MSRRLKTKTSPVSWRLDDDALKALIILEGQDPGKERGQIIGDQLIAAATGSGPPPTIRFNEIDPKEILHLRAELSENRRLVEMVKAALRQARPSTKEEATRLSEAITGATEILRRCGKHDEKLREQAKKSAQVTIENLDTLQVIFKKAAANHAAAIKKLSTDPDAPQRAEYWARFGNFCRLFCPDLGKELEIPPKPTNPPNQ